MLGKCTYANNVILAANVPSTMSGTGGTGAVSGRSWRLHDVNDDVMTLRDTLLQLLADASFWGITRCPHDLKVVATKLSLTPWDSSVTSSDAINF